MSRRTVPMLASGIVATLLTSFALAGAAAQEIVPPTDPVAKAAFDVLEKHCSRCHQEGKLIARERPAKQFGNILKLDELAVSPTYILPGNPLGSKLFRQIADKEMPYDVNYEFSTKYPPVSETDLKALEAWILSLGTKASASCESHTFAAPEDMVAAMAADLDKMPRTRRTGTRYLTLTHLSNICVDASAMKVYRQATIKLVNSLSRSSDVVKLETIDADESIIRINLRDIGWSARDWDNVLAVYPYNLQPDTQLNATIAGATGTQLPYVRADWFAFTASAPPLYHTLLQLPRTFQGLAREQGIDVEANIRNFVAQRSGFQKSGVSQNNRLIERHPSRSGYFWTSYDFAGNRGRQSLFEFPLGPSGGGFAHDGGETIFSLPNGFQAYYLNTAKGDQIDKGPTSIVRDPSRKDFSVTNGISCMGCHDQGMRKAKDEIRDVVTAGRNFPRDVRESVEALYPPHEKMDAIIDGDAKRFADAMTRAGLEPTLKLNGVEMINALAKRYEDDVDLTLAAAELGLDAKEFKESSTDADRRFRTLVRRLEQGSIPRDQFEQSFRDFALDVTDLRVVRIAGQRIAPSVARQRVDTLSLTSDADSYRQGDRPVFTIVAPRDCFLTLTNVDEKGMGTVLLPNRFQQDNRLRAGVPFEFPGTNAPFQYRMKDRGIETVVAVCSDRQDGGDRFRHDFTRSAFTDVGSYTSALARAIAVEPASGPAAANATASGPTVAAAQRLSAATATRASFRAAIRLQVQ